MSLAWKPGWFWRSHISTLKRIVVQLIVVAPILLSGSVTNSWDCTENFADVQLIQNGSLPRRIKSEHNDLHAARGQQAHPVHDISAA